MLQRMIGWCKKIIKVGMQWVENKVLQQSRSSSTMIVVGAAVDVVRTRAELIAENAFLRQQLVVLRRSVKRPTLTDADRRLLVMLARWVQHWRNALLIVKPETLLDWHRQLFKLVWRHKSAVAPRKSPLAEQTIALIKQMASENPRWGAERIRGELLKLGFHASKRTIQKYMRQARPARPTGQTWTTFLHNHAQDVWACDFLPVVDIFFRQHFVFFIVELASRRVVHFAVTDTPTDDWTAQQLREATPFSEGPKYLVRDNDSKFGIQFSRVAAGAGIQELRTPIRAPNANAVAERFLGSVRRECRDHILVFNCHHLRRVVHDYIQYFDQMRPHQGLQQRIPARLDAPPVEQSIPSRITSRSILGGLHYSYEKVA